MIDKAEGAAFRCTLDGSQVSRWLEIPAWMLDRAACPDDVCFLAAPFVSRDSLPFRRSSRAMSQFPLRIRGQTMTWSFSGADAGSEGSGFESPGTPGRSGRLHHSISR